MRAMLVVLVLMVVGCNGATKNPTHLIVVPDAAFQDDSELMDEVRSAASLWSAVGASVEVRLSGADGSLLMSVPAAQWNHAANAVGVEGVDAADDTDELCPIGSCIEFQRELLLSLPPGERVVTLAHEFGHALGLWHVDDPYAVMYRAVDHALAIEGLRPADVAEYRAEH